MNVKNHVDKASILFYTDSNHVATFVPQPHHLL